MSRTLLIEVAEALSNDDQRAEYEELISPYSPASEKASMREVFGATEDDVNRLRIVSLQEVICSLSRLCNSKPRLNV